MAYWYCISDISKWIKCGKKDMDIKSISVHNKKIVLYLNHLYDLKNLEELII